MILTYKHPPIWEMIIEEISHFDIYVCVCVCVCVFLSDWVLGTGYEQIWTELNTMFVIAAMPQALPQMVGQKIKGLYQSFEKGVA